MSEINFTKLTGAGNDFILIDKNIHPDLELFPSLIEKLCDRRFGIGADGLLTIGDSSDVDFEMEYFNADGSTGMLCGNGARCIIRYAEFSGRIRDSRTKFNFQSEFFSGEVLDKNEIKFNLNPPSEIRTNIKVNILEKIFSASFINTGAHHVVIDLAQQNFNDTDLLDINRFPVVKYGSAIRYSEQFAPLGTNVNFIFHEEDEIKIRTYERGVEQETLACGTGAVASAIISHIYSRNSLPLNVRTKSDKLLKINFDVLENNKFANVTLTGPAKIVFKGKIKI